MGRIKWIDERLQAWARWQLSGTRVGASSAFDPNRVSQTKDVRAGMQRQDPYFSADVLEIDMAITALPNDLKRSVIAYYMDDGGQDSIAEHLGITRATLHRRLCSADLRIDEWLEFRREKRLHT